MKKICIIGWYGTETIGDRAILAGLISFFGKVFGEFEINLGSLYPSYSERMIFEDKELYEYMVGYDLKINLFDSKNKKKLKNFIKESDFIFMGGGPIMHIDPLYMVNYGFGYAKKLKKKTGLLGCGIGPLYYSKYKKLALEIIKNSDIVVLRDRISKENILKISKELQIFIEKDKIKTAIDPAVECALKYIQKVGKKDKQDYIVVNLREFPSEYSRDNIRDKINYVLEVFIKDLSKKFKDFQIVLVPMHYYFIGNDDREFLDEIKFRNPELVNIKVQNEILTLEETMELFMNAYFNVGMRFHSVVLQTILSGKNYILDYTEPGRGKISGFVNEIDKSNFYRDRYINLQNNFGKAIDINKFIIGEKDKFNLNLEHAKNSLETYISELNKLLKEG